MQVPSIQRWLGFRMLALQVHAHRHFLSDISPIEIPGKRKLSPAF
jgi:hypothetical protein